MKLLATFALCFVAVAVNGQWNDTTDGWDNTTGYPVYPSTTPPPIVINGSDGVLCSTDYKQAWLDLAIVIEATNATGSQWSGIVGNILTYLSTLPLSNSANVDHTSRIAIFTYNSSRTATQIYAFTDTQKLHNIEFALNAAKPSSSDTSGDIAIGLRTAYNYLTTQDSFRVKGLVLYAATYDDSGTNNPVEAANDLKGDLIKIVTVSFDAANGVSTPRIAALASPGLAVTSKDNLQSFGIVISQLNCRCPAGWTQLTVNNNITYADCFFYQYSNNLQAFTECEGKALLAVVNTPARLAFLGDFVTIGTDTPTDEVSVGLSRADAYNVWGWSDGQSYGANNYPPFAQPPSDSSTFGYVSKKNTGDWQLLTDDGMTNGRYYVCQQRSCDTAHICDLTGN